MQELDERFEPKGVYVSCSSKEIERAKKWMDALRAKGILVTSTWVEVIEKSGKDANPRDATDDQCRQWAKTDVREVISSQVMWMMIPKGDHSFGATFEYTAFVMLSDASLQSHIVSGDYKRSIFTRFSTCVDTDEEAFALIVEAFAEQAATAPVNVG